jgi:hypothetical protein
VTWHAKADLGLHLPPEQIMTFQNLLSISCSASALEYLFTSKSRHLTVAGAGLSRKYGPVVRSHSQNTTGDTCNAQDVFSELNVGSRCVFMPVFARSVAVGSPSPVTLLGESACGVSTSQILIRLLSHTPPQTTDDTLPSLPILSHCSVSQAVFSADNIQKHLKHG